MGRSFFSILCLCMLATPVFGETVPPYDICSPTVFTEKDRTADMAKPYGLLDAETDFLVHPAAMMRVDKVRSYMSFGTVYEKTVEEDIAGDNWAGKDYTERGRHDWTAGASVGIVVPVDVGRMGFFVDYGGKRRKNWYCPTTRRSPFLTRGTTKTRKALASRSAGRR